MALPCDFAPADDPHAGDFIISNQETGATFSACAGDTARWGLELAKRLLAPEEIAETIGPLFVEGTGEAEERKSRRRRPAAAKEEPEQSPEPAAEGVEEPAAAAPDS